MVSEFATYMHKCEYAESTVISYCKVAGKFLNWCNTNSIELESLDYKVWLRYQEQIKNRITPNGFPLKDNSVKQDIGAVRLFFDFLVHEDIIYLNPIKEIHYKDNSEFNHRPLTQDELEELYHCFPTQDLSHPKCPSVAMRNKVIVGLTVFQAIDSTTLKRMNVSDIDLNKGKVYITGTKRSNSRTLNLESCQINAFRQYLEHDREVLQKKINCFTDALFPHNTSRFSIITNDITGKLKSLNLKVTNLKQIRFSVISLWVKKYDLRKTQIMAGHRYISSTENYLKTDLDSLQKATEMYHPLA